MRYDLKYKPIEVLFFNRHICAFKINPKFKCIRHGGGGGGGGGGGSVGGGVEVVVVVTEELFKPVTFLIKSN